MTNYEGYKWIKVKRHNDDQTKSWEERHADLSKHHIEETTFLINTVRQLAKEKEAWKQLAVIQNLAIAAVAKDKNYKCQCGDTYTDGEQCPACFSTYALEIFDKLWKSEKGEGDFPANIEIPSGKQNNITQ